MRPHAERRHNNWVKAIRQRKIDRIHNDKDYYDNLHQYSKNKVPNNNSDTSIQDIKRFEDMNQQIENIETKKGLISNDRE